MRTDEVSFALATTSVATLVGVAVWGFWIDPEPAARWLLLAAGLPLTWGYIEAAQTRGPHEGVARAIVSFHRFTIAWVGLLLALQVGFHLATSVGLFGIEWLWAGRRISGLLLGVGLMVFGNHLPRLPSPWRLEDEPFEWQRVHRFCGWVFALGGLGAAGAWIFLPPSQAAGVAMFILAPTFVLVCGRKLISLAFHPGHRAVG